MADALTERRIATLEREVAKLRTAIRSKPNAGDWRKTIGMFTDDAGVLQIFESAMQIREADRRRARRKKPGKGPAAR